MRIVIKGGVWKNTEDELLKAAVIKYGLNQWARISSLLVRKSAKQCKARWYEWLDPSIKKTEWTREEDEKLLHLAKIMPCQWRTIAPIVGRTADQSLERYEKLLSMAMGKGERYDDKDDPRRLRPGEIDPNPEARPARPDPVDMDEDEKEMLSEAKARLANTRGKKAKRKAREKQLEEARRLASLQKRRELKAAGIEVRGRTRRFAIDYNSEVAFEAKPAAGFFDTRDEDARTKSMQQEFRPVTVEELEGRRRKDIEAALIKQDISRQKVLEAHDAPATVAKANEINEISANRRRGRMMLPAPQIGDAEIDQLARMRKEGGGGGGVVEMSGDESTRRLLGSYSTNATPQIRTGTGGGGGGGGGYAAASAGDSLMQEAAKLAQLRTLGTVFEGGEMPDIGSMDFAGATPQLRVAATPNPLASLATPRVAAAAGGETGLLMPPPSVAGTPMVLGRGGERGLERGRTTVSPSHQSAFPAPTPLRTPLLRDELGLNDVEMVAAGVDPVNFGSNHEARQKAALKRDLIDRLRKLPAPQNEFSISLSDLPDPATWDEAEAAAEAASQLEEDAADVKRRRIAEVAQWEARESLKRSSLMRRPELPRPLSSSVDTLPVSLVPAGRKLASLEVREQAEVMVYAEMVRLVRHDSIKYPLIGREGNEGAKKKTLAAAAAMTKNTTLPADLAGLEEELDPEDAAAARALVAEEAEAAMAESVAQILKRNHEEEEDGEEEGEEGEEGGEEEDGQKKETSMSSQQVLDVGESKDNKNNNNNNNNSTNGKAKRKTKARRLDESQIQQELVQDLWKLVADDVIFVNGAHVPAAAVDPASLLKSYKSELARVRGVMEAEAKKGAKLTQKLQVLLGGLQRREGELRKKAENVWAEAREAAVELECFEEMQRREEMQIAPERLANWREMVRIQMERESNLQERYKNLRIAKEELLAL